MNGYSQPSDYRFSHDSIELGGRAAQLIRARSASLRVLDLCAGCGVVGLEFVRSIDLPVSIDFNEVQDVYQPHFDLNCEWIKSSKETSGRSAFETRWLQGNYETLLAPEFANLYDLVISNPPYFDVTQGKLPPSDFKARCRFFMDSDFATLWRVIRHVLKPSGEALVLVRDLGDHGVDRRATLDRVLNEGGAWSEVESIRGTGVVLYRASAIKLES